METKANYTLVGAFVVVLIVGLVGFAIWISKVDFTEGTIYHSYFEGSVSGLRKGEGVSYNGVPIGLVSEITVDPKSLQNILVSMRIDKPELIRESSFATIETKGLTGLVEIQIHSSSADSPLLKPKKNKQHAVIRSEHSKIQQAIDAAPKLLEKATELFDRISLTFNDKNTKNITEVIGNMAEFTKSLKGESQDLKGFFKDVKASFAELKSGSSELSATMQHFRGLIDENKSGLSDFTSVGLKELTKAMAQFSELSSSLTRVVQKTEQNPLRFITQPDNNTEDLG